MKRILPYNRDDLGVRYTEFASAFRIWVPKAQDVKLNLYKTGNGGKRMMTVDMYPKVRGTWVCSVIGDLNKLYYTFSVTLEDGTVNEVVDLYARSVGVNGNRGQILDLHTTDPEGFDEDVRPALAHETDAVIYELHIRDISADASSGITCAGKFLGMTQRGTTNSEGLSTGLDHILELGVTHVQLMPSFDYASVDERKTKKEQYNWGYDPKNYNVPEGAYSTDPYHGEVRIREMKQMIQTLHANGIRVIMDVVYNHTYSLADSWFQKTFPDYYYRKQGTVYSNGSGCGNETASENAMMRKYIVDSVVYWAREYHVDGFRFDLMAVHDLDTMRAVRQALDAVDPSIMVYGEGWSGGKLAIADSKAAVKKNIHRLERVGAFSDDIRDAIKGSVFNFTDRGFVSGAQGMEERIRSAIMASPAWSGEPTQCINYASCHDNLTLWDKLEISNAKDSESDRIRMNRLAAAIVLTSQGVPFLMAGEEMLRSKPNAESPYGYDENSYASPDATNSIKWDQKGRVLDTCEYYKGLIAFRKAHKALRMTTAEDVAKYLTFMDNTGDGVVAYTLDDKEGTERLVIILNANREPVKITLPEGTWEICVNDERAGDTPLGTADGQVTVARISAMALVERAQIG